MFGWIFGFGFGVFIAVVAIDNNQVPKTGFSCKGRTTGYYADVESGCQVYHMCDGLGRQFSYTCPNATLFQQRMLICDHWYMVNCSKSVDDYTANLRIGHKEMPFVDDSESNPYHRTPRPDLLSHPSQSEYDIIYRTGRAQFGTNLNLVGVESDKNNTTSTTDEPTYSLPSHWSTEFNQQPTTNKPKVVSNLKKVFEGPSSTIKGKPIVPTSTTANFKSTISTVPIPYQVNFKSQFKATTPVYPKSVDVVSEEPSDVGVVPPGSNATNDAQVNFKSEFKATTPVYPKSVDVTSEEPSDVGVLPPGDGTNITNNISDVKVNFKSEFKATTPVYPKTVDITSEEPSDVGVLPPAGNDTNIIEDTKDVRIPEIILDFLPPEVDVNFDPASRTQNKEVALPSKFYQPPKFEPDFTEVQKEETRKGGFKSLNSNEWENLRKKFLIPDYEFPLESVSRPSYDSVLSSFQVSDLSTKKKK